MYMYMCMYMYMYMYYIYIYIYIWMWRTPVQISEVHGPARVACSLPPGTGKNLHEEQIRDSEPSLFAPLVNNVKSLPAGPSINVQLDVFDSCTSSAVGGAVPIAITITTTSSPSPSRSPSASPSPSPWLLRCRYASVGMRHHACYCRP